MQLLFSVKPPKILVFINAGLALLFSSAVSANSFSQISLAAGHEDNVARGEDSRHERGSSFLNIEYSLGKLYEIGLKNSLIVSAQVNASRFEDLPGFDKLGAGVSANYNHKWGLGAYAPLLATSISYAVEDYDGRARDNELLTVDVSYLKRLSPAWFLSTGVDYQDSSSDSLPHDPVISSFGYDPDLSLPFELFDYDSRSVFADLEYSFENGMLLSGGFRRVDGFTVSSTTEPSLNLYKVAEAFYSDSAFRQGWVAYQLEAKTNEWSLGLSIPSSRDSSINFAYSLYDISGVSGHDYLNRIFSISFVHDF